MQRTTRVKMEVPLPLHFSDEAQECAIKVEIDVEDVVKVTDPPDSPFEGSQVTLSISKNKAACKCQVELMEMETAEKVVEGFQVILIISKAKTVYAHLVKVLEKVAIAQIMSRGSQATLSVIYTKETEAYKRLEMVIKRLVNEGTQVPLTAVSKEKAAYEQHVEVLKMIEGVRSKYVHVLNPGCGARTLMGIAPAPAPLPMGGSVQPFSGKVFESQPGSLVTLCTTTMLDELMIVIAQLVEEDMETSSQVTLTAVAKEKADYKQHVEVLETATAEKVIEDFHCTLPVSKEKAAYKKHLVKVLEIATAEKMIEEPNFQHWGVPVPRRVVEKMDHQNLQQFMSSVEVILLARDAVTKAAVLEDLKPPLDKFTNCVSFPTRDIFLGIFAGKKTSLLFVGTLCHSITNALDHYFPKAMTVVALSVSSTTAVGMNGDIVVPSNKSKYVHDDWVCDVNSHKSRKSVIHESTLDPSFMTNIEKMEEIYGIITFAISGISTNNTWIVTAAKVAVDYCKFFLSKLQDVTVPNAARKNEYFTRINIKTESPTLSSLYYLFSMVHGNEDVIKQCSKAMHMHYEPDDENYPDVLTCITRVMKWAETCRAEDNSWNSLISVLRKCDFHAAADEIEKNTALILRYMSLAEAAFLLNDEDENKAKSDSEVLYKNLIEKGIGKVVDFAVSVQINQENENQLYYPQYLICVEVSALDEIEKNIYYAAKSANIHTPIIVVRGVKMPIFACAPGSKIISDNTVGSLGCFLTHTFQGVRSIVCSTCQHCVNEVPNSVVYCDNNELLKVHYNYGIRSTTADICLLNVETIPSSYNVINTGVENSPQVVLKDFETPRDSDIVIKRGAITGYTEMIIKGFYAGIHLIDGRENKNFWNLVNPYNTNTVIAKLGDSGSAVVKPDELDKNIVGILFAIHSEGKGAYMYDFEKNIQELEYVRNS